MYFKITVALCFAYLSSSAAQEQSAVDVDDVTLTSYKCENNDVSKCQLYGLRGNYLCSDEKCRCKKGSRYLKSAYVCHLTNTMLGDSCVLPLDCAVRFSTCSESQDGSGKKCSCDGPMRKKVDGQCRKSCDKNDQCGEYEICLKDKKYCDCRVDSEYTLVERKCKNITCTKDDDCPAPTGRNIKLECAEDGVCKKSTTNGAVGDGGGSYDGEEGEESDPDGDSSSLSVTIVIIIVLGVVISAVLLGALLYFSVRTNCFRYRPVSTMA